MTKEEERKFTGYAYDKGYGETYDDADRRHNYEREMREEGASRPSSVPDGGGGSLLAIFAEAFLPKRQMTLFAKVLLYLGRFMAIVGGALYFLKIPIAYYEGNSLSEIMAFVGVTLVLFLHFSLLIIWITMIVVLYKFNGKVETPAGYDWGAVPAFEYVKALLLILTLWFSQKLFSFKKK